MNVNVKLVRKDAKLAYKGSASAAGSDLFACIEEDRPICIRPHETVMFNTGLAMEIPEGYVGLIFARSGLASKSGLAPANKVGVIDSDYRGEIKVALHNHSEEVKSVSHNERIAQIVIVPYVSADFTIVEELSETVRGDDGFGSTGK